MILPACPFPPLSWYKLAYSSDDTLIEVHENYIKQSLRNRILLANSGGVWDFTLPVHRRNAESRLIKDIVFTKDMDSVFMMKNIRTAYSSSPFYEHFEESLIELFNEYGQPGKSLLEFNLKSIEFVEIELGLSPLNKSEQYITHSEHDFRPRGKLISGFKFKDYPQVFEDRNGFISGRSILDAIFHGGPEAKRWWTDVSLPLK